MKHKLFSPLYGFLFILIVLALFALFVPLFAKESYSEIFLYRKNLPPSTQFWFGTDELGRDLFIRAWWGARVSLSIGISAALLDMVIGVFWGALSGYLGGWVDECMMRLCDILYTIPRLLIVILLTVVWGSGFNVLLFALVLTGWINMARMTRGQILQLKTLEYVQAARTMGASTGHIIARHLIPNALSSILVALTFTIPSAIFTEALLSSLGLGIQAPAASWGMMIQEGLGALTYYPWRFWVPSSLITFTLLCFYGLGQCLRDTLDPKTML